MNERIKAIADAAALLFLQQGYSKTQISHIAKAAGISVGTIYLDFSGKEEILHFVLKCTIDPQFIDRDFERPITDDLFKNLENDIAEVFERSGRQFAGSLADNAGNYSLETLVSDAFDLLSRYAVGCLFIEKNQFDFTSLAGLYKQYRKRFFDTFTQYLCAFINNGSVRPLEHPELSAMLIIEMLSWWAMDIRYTSFETQDIPLELSKKICMDNIISAYKRTD